MTPRTEHRVRVALWALLIVGWAVAVAYMWDALSTVPPPERLEQSRMVAIPTPRMFFAAAAFSAAELAVVLALLWPWRPSFYAARMGFAILALVTWFVMTTPMDLTRMDWVHRRWLASMTLALAAALALLLLYLGVRRVAARRQPTPG